MGNTKGQRSIGCVCFRSDRHLTQLVSQLCPVAPPKPMFSQMPAQIFASPALRNAALALLTAGLAWTTAGPSTSAQASTQSPAAQNPAAQNSALSSATVKTSTTLQPSPVLAATSKRTTDWLVPGILAGSVMVGGVAVVLIMRRSSQSLVTEAPEPLLYSPNSPQTATPETRTSEAKAPEAKAPEAGPQATATKAAATKTPPAKKPPLKTQTPKTQHSKDIKLEPEPLIAEQPKSQQPDLQQPEAQQPEAQPEPTAIAHATTRMPKVSVMDVLVHDLRSKDPAKRQKAIWELGRRGDSRAVQPLVDLLLDSDSRQRSLVLSALSEISTRTLKPMSRALAISMQDENPDVRKNAIRDLTRIYDTLTNISQLLHSACEDPDLEVQETAKWAIGQIDRIKSPMIQGAGRSVSLPESLN